MTRCGSTTVPPEAHIFFHAGIDRVRQIAPVDPIVGHRVSPMGLEQAFPQVFRVWKLVGRKHLVEHVPASLPEAQSVGIVHLAIGTDEVVGGPVGVGRQFLARCGESEHQRAGLQLRLLLGQSSREDLSRRGRRKAFRPGFRRA